MASSLAFRPEVFEMVSRVGRQIEEKLNSKEVFDKLTSRRRRIPTSSKPRERKLLPPQRLIAMLDKQQEADAHTAQHTHKAKSDEDFVFRKQSRQDFYRATVRPSQQKGEVVPPVGYYDPVFKSVEKASPNTSWSKQPKRNRKTLSLDEGAMKLGSERTFPVRATVTFDKQLPRKDSAQQSPHVHRWDNTRGSPLTDRVSVPDMSKALCRPEAFPGTREGHPDYCPNFAPIWKRLSRNMFFAKTPGRKTPRPSSHDLVYDNITYAQVHPKVLTPAFGSSTQRDRDESPFPLFMRNLSSWQSTFSVNEKTLQMRGAIGKFPDPRQKKLRTGTHTATTSPTKRTDTQGMTNVRSSSVASLSENRRGLILGVPEWESRNIPLVKVMFKANITDEIATVEVRQTFKNIENDPIECEYVFPVLDDAAISRMQVRTDDGKVLTASIEDAEEAKESYSDAISEGNQAALGRMETEDRMVLSVGNMAPKSRVVVMFTIVQPVRCEGKDWAFVIPAALLPLFNLQSALEENGIDTDEDATRPAAIHFVHPSGCSYHLHFSLTIQSQVPLNNVHCPSHRVEIVCREPFTEATVQTGSDSAIIPNKDFRVIYETASSMTPSVKVQFDPQTQEYAAMLSFIPPLLAPGEDADDLVSPGEFLLLIDRSGSMQGARIQTAREALLLFIKSLPQQCLFNVISFGSTFTYLFKNSAKYEQRVVEKALSEISRFEADMNGTNIFNPMQAVLSSEPQASLPRTVFLLTDGAVSNAGAVVTLVAEHSKKARVHVFGIGDGVSTSLVINVAKAGNGIAEFISDPVEIRTKVIAVLQKCLAPALTDNEVHWPGMAKQFPSNERIPTCYFGEVFHVFAHFGQTAPPLSTSLLLTCQNSKSSERLSFEVPIGSSVSTGEEVLKLWASRAIKELTFQHDANPSDGLKREIVNLSKKFGVPSKYTAFLCVEARSDPVTGQMQLRKVPIVGAGGSYVSLNPFQARPMCLFCKSAPMCKHAKSHGAVQTLCMKKGAVQTLCMEKGAVQTLDTKKGAVCEVKKSKESKMPTASRTRASARPKAECEINSTAPSSRLSSLSSCLSVSSSSLSASDPVLSLVQTQQIDGHWTFQSNKNLLQGISPPADLQSQFGTEADDVWTTICTVLILQTRHADAEGEWKLVVGKAKRWLKSKGIADVATFADQVAALFLVK